MNYDKPKVTIDLEEYNSLIEEKNRLSGDEYVLMAKTVLAVFMNSNFNVQKAQDELFRLNIVFAIINTGTTHIISPENIVISKITDKKPTDGL